MRWVAVLAVCAFASCTTRDQWLRTASGFEVGYGWNRGDMDSPIGNKDYDQDSTSVWVTIRPFLAFDPPHEVRIVNAAAASDIDEAREGLEACRARELVARDRVARGGSQDGDPARSVPASSSPGLSTGTTISLFAMLGLVISALAYALLPSLRKKVEWWFAAPRVRKATKRRVEFAQESKKT